MDRVWICAIRDGHLQATGRDAKGRKQYRYHARWREVRDDDEVRPHARVRRGAAAHPRARRRPISRGRGLPREKVLATVVRLLETTLIRVGNEEYARAQPLYGLTTLRDRHVEVDGSTVRFGSAARAAVQHDVDLRDRRLARIVAAARSCPGQELFQYLDDDGERPRPSRSADVNDYLREISGDGLHRQGLPHLGRHRAGARGALRR